MEDRRLEFGFIKSNVLYRNISGTEDGLELKVLEGENHETSIEYFHEEYNKLYKSFEKLNGQIDQAENKGSFLIKLQNIKTKLSTHKGLGDYDVIEEKLSNQETLINDIVEKNRARNTEIKQALMLELDEALKNNDFYEVGITIKDIKLRWVKTGRVSDNFHESIENDFSSKIQAFFDKRQIFFDDKKKLEASKLKKYEIIIEKLKHINVTGTLKNEVDNVKALQAEWKDSGKIPEKDFKQLNNKYWDECQKFFDSMKKERKVQNSLSKESLAANLILKKKLIELMTSIDQKALSESVSKNFNELKTKWKETGKTKGKESENLHNSYYELNGSVMEKQFIFNLANKKFKSFPSEKNDQKTFLLKKLTRDLLNRDKTDLATFKENMDNMHVNKGSFVEMLEEKLKLYERKVELKSKILNSLK